MTLEFLSHFTLFGSYGIATYTQAGFCSSTDEYSYDSVSCFNVPLAGRQTPYGLCGTTNDLLFTLPGATLVLLGSPKSHPGRRRNAS